MSERKKVLKSNTIIINLNDLNLNDKVESQIVTKEEILHKAWYSTGKHLNNALNDYHLIQYGKKAQKGLNTASC